MKTLEKALQAVNSLSVNPRTTSIDARIFLGVTIVYMAVVLSVPMLDPARLVWLFIYPIVTAEMTGIGYGRVFVRSLYVLPLIVLIGIFNPILDHRPCWEIGNTVVSCGWVSFISIVLRGLLALQALLVLVMSVGFYDMVDALRRLGCPAVLATQLLMVYRYMGVLLDEALTMHRAREARGFGRKSYPLKMWGTFVGQLLVRSLHRARNVEAAMRARGFDGTFPTQASSGVPSAMSWVWLAVWCSLFVALRIFDVSSLAGNLIMRHV